MFLVIRVYLTVLVKVRGLVIYGFLSRLPELQRSSCDKGYIFLVDMITNTKFSNCHYIFLKWVWFDSKIFIASTKIRFKAIHHLQSGENLCFLLPPFILRLYTQVGISGTTAKSHKRKCVPSSHTGHVASVASSRKSQTKVGTVVLIFCKNPAMLFHVNMICLAKQAKRDVEKSFALR